tara:strand:+ start:24 stop:638 length:615 start_codon:yes stop_codon:yes gene_type:complete
MSHGLAVSRSVIAHNLGYASLNHIQERTDLLAEHGLIDIVQLDPSKERQTRAGELLRISRMGLLAIEGKMTFEDVSHRTERGTTEIEEYSLEHIVREEFGKVFSVAWTEAKDEFKKLTTKINKQNQEEYEKSRTKNRERTKKLMEERITALEDGWKRGQSEMLEKIQTCMSEDREFYRNMHAEILAEIKDTIKEEVNLAMDQKP